MRASGRSATGSLGLTYLRVPAHHRRHRLSSISASRDISYVTDRYLGSQNCVLYSVLALIVFVRTYDRERKGLGSLPCAAL